MIIQYNFPALIFTRNTVKFPQETNANVAGMTSRGNQQYDQLLAKTPSRKLQHSNNISMNHFHLPLKSPFKYQKYKKPHYCRKPTLLMLVKTRHPALLPSFITIT